jgi:GAF domain-containing protein
MLQDQVRQVGSLRLARLLRNLALTAIEVIGADIVAIYQYDPDDNTFVRPAVIEGVLIRPDETGRPIQSDWLPELMIRDGREFVSENVEDVALKVGLPAGDRARPSFVKRERVRSAVGLLLEAGGRRLGVIFFNFRHPQKFPASRVQLMRMFAAEASIAIQSARLHRAALLTDIRTERDGDHLPNELNRLLASAGAKVNAEAGLIRLYDPNDHSLKRVAWYGDLPQARPSVRHGEGLSGIVLTNPTPLVVSDIDTHPLRHHKAWRRDLQFNSFACLPLKLGDRLVGTLFLASTVRNTFTIESVEELAPYADRAVKAIQDRAERLKQSGKQRRIAELDLLLNERRTVSQIVALTLTVVTMEGGLEFNRAYLFLQPTGQSRLVCEYGIFPSDRDDAKRVYEAWEVMKRRFPDLTLQGLIDQGGMAMLEEGLRSTPHASPEGVELGPSLLEENQLLIEVFSTRRGIVGDARDLHRDDVLRTFATGRFALVPVTANQRTIGVLYVDNAFTLHARPIDDGDLNLLRSCADSAAAAIVKERQRRESGEGEGLSLAHAAAIVASGISHQLAPVLATSHSSLKELEQRGDLSPDARRACAVASSHLIRAGRVVDYWRLLGERGPNRIRQFLQLMPLSQLLEELTETVRSTVIALRGGDVTVTPVAPDAATECRVNVHLDALKLDFENFAKDSLRYKREGLEIRIGPRNAPDTLRRVQLRSGVRYVRVCYSDNGPGIPRASKQDVFEFNYSVGGGAGVGLALARALAREHGGELVETGSYVKGGGRNSGVRFELYLPVAV